MAATKTFLAQLVALNLLALYLAQERGSMPEGKLLETIEAMSRLPEQIEEVLEVEGAAQEAAKKYADATDFIFIGRGVGTAVAMEGALKLKEISYIHAEGYAAGELKHGAIALLQEGVPVVAVMTGEPLYEKMLANVEEVRARNASTILVAPQGERTSARSRRRHLRGSDDQAAPDARAGHDPLATACVLRGKGEGPVSRQAAQPREERHGRVDDAGTVRPILTPDEMGLADRATIEAGTPSEVLMDRAGRAVARVAIRVAGGRNGRRALVVCGKGNNGGDGFVAARELRREGLGVTCLVTFDPEEAKGPAAHHLAQMRAMGIVARPFTPAVADEDIDVVVDAILGTGSTGAPRGVAAEAIAALDGLPGVVAVDIPSGVDGTSGRAEGGAIHADTTVALAAQKLGTVLLPGASFAGEVVVADIGIDVRGWKHGDAHGTADRAGPYVEMVEGSDVSASLTPRPLGAHKRSSGSVAILAGSSEVQGAPLLTSLGALRMGAGYVTLGSVAEVRGPAAATQPEILFRAVTDTGVLGKDALDRFADVIERADAVAIGPGMGTGDDQRALVERALAELEVPVVLDADGINVLAGSEGALADRRAPTVLTPHPAELARLLGCSTDEVTGDRIGAAAEASRRFPGTAVVLKGYRTIVTFNAGAAALVIPTGGPELATAGTGDVLTGVVATVIAGGVPGRVAGAVAAYVHGLAGSVAAGSKGTNGVLASDVAEALPEARARASLTR